MMVTGNLVHPRGCLTIRIVTILIGLLYSVALLNHKNKQYLKGFIIFSDPQNLYLDTSFVKTTYILTEIVRRCLGVKQDQGGFHASDHTWS
jgi:hypothetical protein